MDKLIPATPLPAPQLPVGRHPARAKKRAQSMVEFALLSPLLFTLVFGIMEFGWLFRSHMTVYFATKEGTRAAGVGGSSPSADSLIQNAVDNTLVGMSYPDIIELSIYHADGHGDCIIFGGVCQENIYVPDLVNGGWTATTANWPPSSRRDDTQPTDVVAVRLVYRHHFLINFLPGAVGETTINNYSMMNVEPTRFPTPTPP